MDMGTLIAQAQERRGELLAQRQAHTDGLRAMRDRLDSDPAVTPEAVDAAVAARDALDPQIAELSARIAELEDEQARDQAAAALAATYTPRVHVQSEPEVYRAGGKTSYFRDLFHARQRSDRDAIDRLVRNDRQVMETRAIGVADGGIGEFVPPAWMVAEFEKLARAGRVTADLLRKQPLPAGTDSISVPLVSGGSSVAEQTHGSAASETDMTSTSATAAVATMAGTQTVNLQLVEQSPIDIDGLILADLAAAHAVTVDTFCISNNATGKKGLLNVTGINAVTYTDSSATVPEFWPKLVNAQYLVHANRFLPARAVIMHPRRWAWLQAALDSSNRPYVSDELAAAIPLLGQSGGSIPEGLAGTIRGLALPVFLDPNIPTNLGGGTEDAVIVARPEDIVLYESPIQAGVAEQTAYKTLQVVFRLYNYVALQSARAPKSISAITGTGLSAPTF